jgi:hypothetical protein
MWILLIIGLCLGIALLCWAMIRGNAAVRLFTAFAAVAVAYSVGNAWGTAWERLKNYDQYIYEFSQYSKYMRSLAERQELAELTNNIILFDTKFNSRQNAQDLQDVVSRILKVGPYYQEKTNAATLLHLTNSP